MKSVVAGILGAGGPIARAMGPGYEVRAQQVEMAEGVARAMAGATHLIVEAGTGVGKSFAYLVPSIVRVMTGARARRDAPSSERANPSERGASSDSGGPGGASEPSGPRVVIVTNTIALQEQIVRRDIPFLMETLEGPSGTGSGWGLDPKLCVALKPALCKGRGNYVSIRRLKMASARQDALFIDAAQKRSLHVIEDWAYGTEDGTLASLPALERPGVWDRVQSDTDNCMGRKCPHHQECFYQRARREMEAANLLVCNHALFFADLKLRQTGAGFLPAYDHVVIDEAHAAEDVACDHFGLALSEGRVEHLLASLYHDGSGRGYLAQLAGTLTGVAHAAMVDACVAEVHKAQDASRAFFQEMYELGASGSLRSGRVRTPGLIRTLLGASMRALGVRLKTLKEAVSSEPDQFELNAYATRADAIAWDADALVQQSVEGCVYWIEGAEDASWARSGTTGSRSSGRGGAGGAGGGGRSGGGARLKLACSPIEVGPLLRTHLFESGVSVVLTSATLALRESAPAETIAGAQHESRGGSTGVATRVGPDPFEHLRVRLGCEEAATMQLGSPFDHAGQSRLIVDLGAAPPSGEGGNGFSTGGRDRYVELLSDRVLAHLRETGGGAFVLFTSFDILGRVASALDGPLARLGWPMLVQGRDGSPGQVLERFRRDENSVLMGAASFWQGVDVKGRGLRNVIITKLPFDPPDRPLVEARGELISARGGNAFMDDQLPRAILRFKQGYGRLIRGADDRGQVVVLDPRIVTKRYGKLFVQALPAGVPVVVVGRDDEHDGPS